MPNPAVLASLGDSASPTTAGAAPAPVAMAGGAAPTFAALDLGTNNCRLLVARAGNGALAGGRAFDVVDAFSRIVRLGEGVERHGTLSPAAMDRTIDALKVCAGKIRHRRVAHARHVATEACRRASNCGEFIARVRRETGLTVEIISSAEEAALALAGVSSLLDCARPHAVVFDIGGGSTEIMWARLAPADRNGADPDGAGRHGGAIAGAGVELLDSVSLPFGVINLSENFGGQCVTPETYERMVAKVRAPMAEFDARHGIARRIAEGAVQMLGTSGTVTTLAGIHLGLPCYDRNRVDGCHLDFAEVAAVTDRLLRLDYKARAQEPCIGPSRADLVLAGCAILTAICRTWPVGRLRVADRGVREGILFNLMRQVAATNAPIVLPAR